MKAAVLFCGVMALTFALIAADPASGPSSMPQFNPKHELLRPTSYREWIFLSSGLGMAYGSPPDHQMFTNVFVPQWAYREFLHGGRWPEKTIFVVEERGSESKGSINKFGHFQSGLMGIGVEVKDSSRFAEKWAYFNFGEDTPAAAANPQQACWQCHEQHAAVEHSFVQFYPTLIPVAKKFGSYKQRPDKPAK